MEDRRYSLPADGGPSGRVPDRRVTGGSYGRAVVTDGAQPGPEGLRAEAKVVRAGGRLVWTEADVLADGEIVGKFASTGIRVAFDPQAYISGQGSSNE